MRLDLGEHSVLLTGDAEAGPRISPDQAPPPKAKHEEPEDEDTEGRLMTHHAQEIDVDILQVAHHGSMTSSRPDFIEAVSPIWALIGAGPRRYSEHRLPDATVERMLEETVRDVGGYVLSTDFDDRRCPVTDRIGRNDSVQEGSGGCSNYVLFLILCGLTDIEGEWHRGVAYVGMSRARAGLHVIIHADCESERKARESEWKTQRNSDFEMAL